MNLLVRFSLKPLAKLSLVLDIKIKQTVVRTPLISVMMFSESDSQAAAVVVGLQGPNMAATGNSQRTGVEGSGVRVNGFDDIPRPFLIGVGGGTASGKVETIDVGV